MSQLSGETTTRTERAASTVNSGAVLVDVLPQHQFDADALWRYLTGRLPDFSTPVTLQQFQGGQSNPTFLITTNDQRYVLRKKPPGKLLPSAHQVEREYRVLHALAASAVPVPAVRLLCEDAAIIGTPFYVMDHVDGRVVADVSLPGFAPAERLALYRDLVRVLAAIHSFDWRAGLGDFGRPEGYVARQLERWSKQYVAARTDDDPVMDRLAEWLRARIPGVDESALVHGDYRVGNLILHPREPRIVAVLDWELATLGHPIGDLAYACMLYRLPALQEGVSGLAGLDLTTLGIPNESELVDAYCRAAGRTAVDHWPFFVAFSFFRLAAIAQGVYARGLQGNAADRRAREYGKMARDAAAIGWSIASEVG